MRISEKRVGEPYLYINLCGFDIAAVGVGAVYAWVRYLDLPAVAWEMLAATVAGVTAAGLLLRWSAKRNAVSAWVFLLCLALAAVLAVKSIGTAYLPYLALPAWSFIMGCIARCVSRQSLVTRTCFCIAAAQAWAAPAFYLSFLYPPIRVLTEPGVWYSAFALLLLSALADSHRR